MSVWRVKFAQPQGSASISAGVLTLNGTGWGTKTLNADASYDDFEAYTVDDRTIDVAFDNLGSDWLDNCTVQSDLVKKGSNAARMRYYGSAMFPRQGYDFASGYTEIYVSYWINWRKHDNCEVSSISGTFTDGETVTFSPSGATATFYYLNTNGTTFNYVVSSGTPTTADSITGDSSSATCNVDTITTFAYGGVWKLHRLGAAPFYNGNPKMNGEAFPESGQSYNRFVAHTDGFNCAGGDGSLHSPDPMPDWGTVNQWSYIEQYYRLSDAGVANGASIVRVDLDTQGANGTFYHDSEVLTTREAGCSSTIDYAMLITGMDNLTGKGSFDAFIDSVYVDVSNDGDVRKRVVVGDASTYSACTVLSPQPLLTWADDEITATFNDAALTAGTNYVYIIDETGAPYDSLGIGVVTP